VNTNPLCLSQSWPSASQAGASLFDDSTPASCSNSPEQESATRWGWVKDAAVAGVPFTRDEHGTGSLLSSVKARRNLRGASGREIVTTRHRIIVSILVLVVLPVSACGGQARVVSSHTGVVKGVVRAFGGGPLEPTPIPKSTFSARVEVRANNRVMATQQTPPGHRYDFSLPVGKYILRVQLDDQSYLKNVGPLFCNDSPVTIRSGHTTRIDVICLGTAG
jgi:hypothetical protein